MKIPLALLFSLIFSMLCLEINSAPNSKNVIKYAVIVDAGSSGSRIYVYKYNSKFAVPNLEQVKGEDGKPWNYKIEPGISTKAGKLDEVEDYVRGLLQHLKDEVSEAAFPRAAWGETPFMWFATAGMRLLSATDADHITNKLREVAKNKAVVPFKFEDRWARTLSGEEEGAFAWISLNYLNGLFSPEGQEGVRDYGVVETGGASAQMTFLANGNILANKFLVIIDRKVYPLYTHSFLYFGQDQIIKRIFKNECFCVPEKTGCTPCINDDGFNGKPVESACLIKGYEVKRKIDHDGVEVEIDLKGTGNASKCAEEMDFLFRPDYTCFTKPCSFAGIYQPPFTTQAKFYGTSAIRYAVEAIGLLEETKDVTWPAIRSAADAYCAQPLSQLDVNNRYAWSRCLTGIFVAKEFEHLKFSKDHQITIQSFDTWTVGAVLYQLELMEILLPGTLFC